MLEYNGEWRSYYTSNTESGKKIPIWHFFSSVFLSLPTYTQHLLVLLFGTFRVIHSNCEQAQTGMTAEALGVSVAPSFFHTCVATGKTAKMEDVERFKVSCLSRGGIGAFYCYITSAQ